jgi:hypothetical protein
MLNSITPWIPDDGPSGDLLSACRRVGGRETTLLLIDRVVPSGSGVPPEALAEATLMDIQTLVTKAGRSGSRTGSAPGSGRPVAVRRTRPIGCSWRFRLPRTRLRSGYSVRSGTGSTRPPPARPPRRQRRLGQAQQGRRALH